MQLTGRTVRIVRLVAAVLVAAAVLGGCSSSDDAAPTSNGGLTQSEFSVRVRTTSVGKVLVDRSGRTLYVDTPDGTGSPRCTDSCAGAWPPVAAEKDLPAGKGVTAKVGQVKGESGDPQMTVADQPVYRFGGDVAPGDVRGQGQGGVWFVLDPTGAPVR